MEDERADDLELVRHMAASDQTAFSSLMGRHGNAVFGQVWRVAESADEVEDIVHEVFLILWRKRRTVVVYGRSLLPWLLVATRNVGMNFNRRAEHRRTQHLPPERWESLGSVTDVDSADREKLETVLEEITRLSSVDQRLCALCLVEGLGYREAAASLGLSEPAARKRVQRIRTRLRGLLSGGAHGASQ